MFKVPHVDQFKENKTHFVSKRNQMWWSVVELEF